MNQNHLDLETHDTAAIRRELGISRAADKADRDHEGWQDDALAAVCKYLAQHPDRPFLAEEVRAWCETTGVIAAPENERAWGAVMRRAAKDGYICKVGYAPARSSNLSPKVLWEPTP